MKALGYTKRGPISADSSVVAFDAAMPQPGARDLLVEVRGVSVNPVDVKVRANREPEGGPRILGFDAAGVVKEVGKDVANFKPGDEVFYAGEFTRPGSNAEFQAVDERLVGRKPIIARLCNRRSHAADEHHRMGDALRQSWSRRRRRRRRGAAGCWRCWRRRVDPDPVGQENDRTDSRGDSVARRYRRLGQENGRRSRHQPPSTAQRRNESPRNRSEIRGDHQPDGQAFRRDH